MLQPVSAVHGSPRHSATVARIDDEGAATGCVEEEDAAKRKRRASMAGGDVCVTYELEH